MIVGTNVRRASCFVLCCVLFIVLALTIYARTMNGIDHNNDELVLSDTAVSDEACAFEVMTDYVGNDEETLVAWEDCESESFQYQIKEYLERGFEVVFSGLVGVPSSSPEPFHDGDFVLSAPPGFHDEPFDLVVSIPSIPNVVIYYTIDGSEPKPGKDRFVTRGNRIIQVSGRISDDGKIGVHDRSGYWGYSILTYHSDSWFRRNDVLPVSGTDILQGTAFRFRGFADGLPVTDTITVTYIIAKDVGECFAHRPVIAVTASHEDFLYVYGIEAWGVTTHRIFNYEYFLYDDGYIAAAKSSLKLKNPKPTLAASNSTRMSTSDIGLYVPQA